MTTLFELNPQDYPQAASLFAPLDIHLAVRSLLEGRSPGHIYVDDPARPSAGLARIKDRLYLAGETGRPGFNQALQDWLAETIYTQEKARQGGGFLFDYEERAAGRAEQIAAVLAGRQPAAIEREYLTCRPHASDWRASLPPGFSLRHVNQELLDQTHLGYLDDLREEMCSERASIAEFLQYSFGVCLVNEEDELAGWCLSEYNCAGRCEVGIATRPPYQRRGLATLMTHALAELAAQHAIQQIGWHCYTTNRPSVATALKAGFERAGTYTGLLLWSDPLENLAIHGSVHFQRQEYARALEWFERAFTAGLTKGWAFWRAACAAAMLEQRQAAFTYLRQAIAAGFDDQEDIQSSPYLLSLHDAPEWRELLEH